MNLVKESERLKDKKRLKECERLKKERGGLEMYEKEDSSNTRIIELLKEIRNGINITFWFVMILLLIKVIEYFE